MRIFQVDAFTDSAFAGNPAAVCLLDRPADTRWMQQLAAEMNLAETAFVEPRPGGYLLRWFTPVVEVVLCGHATLASAHVLYETGLAAAGEPITFQSASGPLAARQDDGSIVLDFPATPASPHAGRARRHGAGLDRPGAGGFHDRGGDRGRVDRPAAGPGPAGERHDPRRDRDRPGRPGGRGLRVPLLRARCRDTGGSGHRL